MTRPVASVIYVGLAVVLAALVWMVLGAVGAGIEIGFEAAAAPLRSYGPVVPATFLVVLFGGAIVLAFYTQRREQRRLYALDKTIHVEPKHKAPLWAVIGTTIVFGMVGFGMLGGLLSLFF